MIDATTFSESYDTDSAELLLPLFLLSFGVLFIVPESRNPSVFEQRLLWDQYCNKHIVRGTFKRRLRMSKQSFDKLLSYIYDDLVVNANQAYWRGGAIIPELCLYCTLRWLAGGSYLDICDIAGISQASFYRVVWKTITAIVLCDQLIINFPQTDDEIGRAIAGFASISTECAIKNCVGVVDGYLMRIRVPSKKEVSNVRSFFSGHYQCYGLNIQGVADHHSRFIYFAVAAPGVSPDRDAIAQCNLKNLIQDLPFGVCVIGDAAYEATENLVPIYQGLDRLQQKYDNFNFFASQCRIRVEMAFGLMQMKWGILQRPLCCSLKNVKWMAQAIARLHNFVIDERLAEGEDPVQEVRRVAEAGQPSYHPTVPHDHSGNPIDLDQLLAGTIQGHSHLREEMVRRVQRLQLQRPIGNRINRRKN